MQSRVYSRASSILMTVAVLMLALFGLTGCWSDVDMTIGTESDDAMAMIFYNSTGKDIDAVSVSESGDDSAEPESLEFDHSSWEYGMKSRIYCDPSDAGYDIELTYEDGETATLHDVTFSESDTVVVSIDEDTGITYMSYNDENEETIYTLDAEKAIEAAE